ncbi:MAG TPA: terminase family protein [Polyangiales bacterium]|nr:terminase family protein [Polyangiales bacterium]
MQWGAGSGKTYTGAQMVRQWTDSGEARTVNIAGPTWVDTMRTMVHGSADAPGLMGVWPEHQRPQIRMAKDDPYLTTHNGAKIQLFAAQKSERFRGAAGGKAWFDEVDAWKPEGMTLEDAFALAEQRIRQGMNPQIICTTTPKRKRLVAQLVKRSDCVVTRASMYDNESNLPQKYINSQTNRYEGTRLGRQELLGELLPDVAGAIVNAEMIDSQRVVTAPDLIRVVVGVDPFGGGGDACGIGAAAKGIDGEGYVLADRTCRLGPDGWARRAIELAIEVNADCIVYEANFGGDMVPTVLKHAMTAMGASIRVKRVWASKGKAARFEPVGGKYERGEIHHVGTFPELEDEIVQFTPDGYDGEKSPNRADAMVFQLAELFPDLPAVGWDRANELNERMQA